jgi:hypothetical protein
MNVKEMSRLLHNLKIHLDQTETWVSQGMQMIYELEEKIMDIEEYGLSRVYEDGELFEEAASKMNNWFVNPPRLKTQINSRRCDNNHIVAADINQSNFEYNIA